MEKLIETIIRAPVDRTIAAESWDIMEFIRRGGEMEILVVNDNGRKEEPHMADTATTSGP